MVQLIPYDSSFLTWQNVGSFLTALYGTCTKNCQSFRLWMNLTGYESHRHFVSLLGIICFHLCLSAHPVNAAQDLKDFPFYVVTNMDDLNIYPHEYLEIY